MKVLTLKQPWASLVIDGFKKYEFRTWKTKYRGEILIHAGKTVDKEAYEKYKKYLPYELPTEKILGSVEITDCILIDEKFNEKLKEQSDIYANNHIDTYAWKIENVKKLEKQIEVKGKLGLWNLDI